MRTLLLTLLLSAFASTPYAADTDSQTNGAELGTQETPQAQEQSSSSHKKSSDKPMKKRHSNNKMKNSRPAANASDNPLQPTDTETAPGASTR